MAASADLVAPLANMLVAVLNAAHECAEQDQPPPPEPQSNGVCPSVDDGAGPRAHRVDGTPVRSGGGSCPSGLGSCPHRRYRLRPGPVRPFGRASQRFSRPGQPRLSGRGRRHLWPGGLSPGALVGGSGPPAGTGPPDRHAHHRRRWHLRPARFQRSAVARPEKTCCILHLLFNFAVQKWAPA
jgi:hypothetical protein